MSTTEEISQQINGLDMDASSIADDEGGTGPGTDSKSDTRLTHWCSPDVHGYVYFIRAGEAIKIGYSVHPIKRMSELQTANPEPMELLGTVRGTIQDERDLHADFSHLEIREEWFRAEEELLDFIEEISGRFIDRELRPRVSPATRGVVNGLLKQRQEVGAVTTLGHRYSILAEQIRHFDHAGGEQRANLANSMARTIEEIERLSAT